METEAKQQESAAQRVQRDQNRVDFLELLYLADTRDDPEHPYANTYTGLFETYCFLVGEAVLGSLVATWHESDARDIALALIAAT